MQYTDKLNQVKGVQKKWLGEKGNSPVLYFVPVEGTDKYEFCSPDEKLQTWCENVKNKKIKGNVIMRVVDAAKQAMKSPQSIQTKTSSATKFKENPIGWVNEKCQAKQIDAPSYEVMEVAQGGGLSLVSVVAEADWMDTPIGYRASNQKIAKKSIAEEIAEKYFAEELQKELASTEKTEVKPIQTESQPKTATQPERPARKPGEPMIISQNNWAKYPWEAFMDHCKINGITYLFDKTNDMEDYVLKVGKDEFYAGVYDIEGKYRTDSKAKHELAKLYYQRVIVPELKKRQRKSREEAPEKKWRDYPILNMRGADDKNNVSWNGFLTQLLDKAHITKPEFTAYHLVDGKEKKVFIPKSREKYSLVPVVAHLEIEGLHGYVKGKGSDFHGAKQDAAKNFLKLCWLDNEAEMARAEGNDKMAEFYTNQLHKLETDCVVKTQHRDVTQQRKFNENNPLAVALTKALDKEKI